MWVELPAVWIAVVNCVGIPVVHLLVSWVATCLPARVFESAGSVGRVQPWERGLYERVFRVRKWKDLLPDAAPWFGGVPKGRLGSGKREELELFCVEARRGEWAHWVQMLGVMLFVVWTPLPWAWVIVGYAVLSNAPCVVSLRYARSRVGRVLRRGELDEN